MRLRDFKPSGGQTKGTEQLIVFFSLFAALRPLFQIMRTILKTHKSNSL